MAVFLLLGLLLGVGFAHEDQQISSVAVFAVPTGVFGGPADVESSEELTPYVEGVENLVLGTGGGGENEKTLMGSGEAAVVIESGLPGDASLERSDVFAYKVRRGDTLYGIAKYFGVTIETLTSANPGLRSKIIQPGDELKVLPASGIVYRTGAGDTIELIAARFNVPEESIMRFNRSVNFNSLGEGASLVIPGVASSFAYNAPSTKNFHERFIKPADGHNWGELHPHNAVDIAGVCGTPIVAAAEGLVIPDENLGDGRGGWNSGYGKFALIEHPFGDGVRTRYAHLNTVLVSVGDYVKQGQEIGSMGDTGDATGCHVHFEVRGAANPFAK